MIPESDRYSAREEKVSAGKLHASQYIVVLVLAVLATGMWRLQILGADNYRYWPRPIVFARTRCSRPAARSSTAKAASWSTTILR